jgi:hypothetical protein
MKAFFCEKTGERIAAPGVSKTVDPIHGTDAEESTPPNDHRGTSEDADRTIVDLRNRLQWSDDHAAMWARQIASVETDRDSLSKSLHECAQQLPKPLIGSSVGEMVLNGIVMLKERHEAEIAGLTAAHAAELDQVTAPEKPVDPSAAPDAHGRRRKN